MTTAAAARHGRVIEAAIDRFTAECFARGGPPPLGELVAVEDAPEPIYAVIAGVITEGVDPSRRVTARGEPEHDLERVLADNPHVPALLTTTFEAVVVGHSRGGRVRQYLPPAPASILARVRACTDAEAAGFTGAFDFLRLLLDAGPLADDVIAAALRGVAHQHGDERAFLVRAGKALAPLLAREPARLNAILRRMQP